MNALLLETKENLFNELQLTGEKDFKNLDQLIQSESRYIKDLKINVSNALNSAHLTKKEAYLLSLGVALNEKNETLRNGFEGLARAQGASDAEIAEVIACVSLLATNNVFYRFRHFIQKEFYEHTPAGIKMSIMMNPVLGKEFFELLSLMISALNGCELCVKSHEESVLKHGSNQARVLDSIKLGAILKGLIVTLV